MGQNTLKKGVDGLLKTFKIGLKDANRMDFFDSSINDGANDSIEVLVYSLYFF